MRRFFRVRNPTQTATGLARYQPLLAAIALAFLAGTAALAILLAGDLLGSVDRSLVDVRFALRPKQVSPPGVVMVTLDRQAAVEHNYTGQVPPRRDMARAVDLLRVTGARIIVLDFDLAAGSDPHQDLALAGAIRRAGNVVYGFSDVQAAGVHGGDFLLFGSQWGSAVTPRLHAVAGSNLNYEPIRRVPYEIRYGTSPPRVWPSLARVAVARVRGTAVPRSLFSGGAWIDFYGPPGTVPHVRFTDLLAGRVPPGTFAGKVVLVGVDNPLVDRHVTANFQSSTNRMAGVEVLANQIGTILRGFPVRSTSTTQDALWIYLLAAVFPLAALGRRLWAGLVVTVIAAGGFAVFAQLDFNAGQIVPIASPATGLLLSVALSTAKHYRWLAGDRQRLRRLFAEMDPTVVDAVLAGSGRGDVAPTAIVAGYRVESRIAEGGMGAVYQATQLALGRLVALKVIRADHAQDSRYRERFVRESRMASSIEHPNVIPIYEAGDADGILFIAMRYVDGPDLETRLRLAGPLDVAQAVATVCQLAGALQRAHENGLIHRDIKPANVLLTLDEPPHVYLTDFGVARPGEGVTHTSDELVGSAAYMAPEQITGAELTAATDIYALGGVLFTALTGHLPYERETELATMWAHVHADPPCPSDHTPGIPSAVDLVVARAMAKDPAERFASAQGFARALRTTDSGSAILS